MGKLKLAKWKIITLFLLLFLNTTLIFSQENSLEIVQNFSKINYQKAAMNEHKVNYKGDAPFVMLSAYSKDLTLTESVSFRIKTKEKWSDWTAFKKPLDGEDFDRVVFDAVFIDTTFSDIQFKSSEIFNSNIVFRLYIPEFTKELEKNERKIAKTTNSRSAQGNCPQPAYRERLDWCPSGNCTKPSGSAITPTHIVIHHSAGNTTSSDFAAVVRGYWNYHVNTRGWADIGYNWLVDPNGVIYEGRGDSIRGAHSPCMNGTSTGMCLIGKYSTNTPSTTMITALERLIAWDASDKNIDILATSYSSSLGHSIANVSGHRTGKDLYPSSNCTSTTCPGSIVYNMLGNIKTNAANRACYGGSSYCTSQGNSSLYEWIKGVKIGTTNKTSGNDGGYADRSNHTFTIEKDKNTAILLQPGYRSTAYNENWKIWIDLNKDGDFNDAGEQLFDNPGVAKYNISGTIKIPASAAIGVTKMRVSMNGSSANYTLNPCSIFAYGEVEDYTVNITARNTYNPPSVCSLTGNNSNYEWINVVAISSQSKVSGNDNGYANYSNFVFNLQSNNTHWIALTPGYSSTQYNENWKIWIDFNQDGDFSDAGEQLFDNSGVSKGRITGSITIPSVVNGNYRMRVGMNGTSSNYTLNPCGSFTYGEVEDYMVAIRNSSAKEMNDSITTIMAYPNPVKDLLTIKANNTINNITVYSIDGSLIYKKDIQDKKSLDIKILTDKWKSGLYMLVIEKEKDRQIIKIIKQ